MSSYYRYKRSYDNDTKWIKEGRGQGEKENYSCWRRVHEENYPGQTLRFPNPCLGRIHQVFGTGQIALLYEYMFDPHIVDIRENYPLTDRDKIAEISYLLGFKPPRYTQTNTEKIILQDFLLTYDDSTYKAVSLRREKSANNAANDHIYKLQEKYWSLRHNTSYEVVIIEKDINQTRTSNLRHIYRTATDIRYILPEKDNDINCLSDEFKKAFLGTLAPVAEIARHLEHKYSLPAGLGVNIFFHLIKTKEITCDIDNAPINILKKRQPPTGTT